MSIQLSSTFKQLDGLLYVDPEDLCIDSVTKSFTMALAEHDFWYDRSDDTDVYALGRVQDSILTETRRRFPELQGLYLNYVAIKEGRI